LKKIYIVRHCQAVGQEADAPLTGQGELQALELAEFLSGEKIDRIVSSSYRRAYDTISPFAERTGIQVVLDSRLTERVLTSSHAPEWREMLRRTYDELDLCFEGGESSNTAMNRAVSVVNEALQSSSSNAILVSHGNLISLLLKHYDPRFGFNEWEALSNPDVYQLTFRDEVPEIQRIWRP